MTKNNQKGAIRLCEALVIIRRKLISKEIDFVYNEKRIVISGSFVEVRRQLAA